MYAVIQTGGKQYRVQPGEVVQIEKIEGEVGAAAKFGNVLMVGKPGENAQVWLGKPELSGATVDGEIVGQGRGEKILILKMKRRTGYRRTQGHRQEYTQVLITGLSNGSGEQLAISDSDKSASISKFQSHLKPKGIGLTPKTLGSRKRLAAARDAEFAAGTRAPKAGAKAATTTAAAPATEKKAAEAKTVSKAKAAPKAKA